jgi:hypothetical protein
MGRRVTLELTDAEHAALEKAAGESGQAPDEWAAARVREHLPRNSENRTGETVHPVILEMLQGIAANKKQPLEEVVARWKRETAPSPRPILTPEEYRAADESLSRHVVDSGHPVGTDNEAIDADLAREYGDDHRELMYERGIYEALTTDHHFEQEGFRCLLK